MRIRGQAVLVGLVAVALVGATGCVTKKRFRENAESVDGRVTSVESAVEANERRIEDLRLETDSKVGAVDQKASEALRTGQQAQSKADSAQATAEEAVKGRLLWSVTLNNDQVKFSLNRASLSDEAKQVLDDLATKVKSYGKALYIEVEGHTDSSGEESYNKMLGEKRAMAARDYLSQSGGIPLHAINTISYGETQPVGDNSTREGRSQNRRIVVKVLE